MKLILFTLLLLLTLTVTSIAAPPRTQGKVFNLVVNDESICTCFAVEGPRRERMIMTAGHCAKDLSPGDKIFAYSKELGVKYPLRLYSYKLHWPDTDYSIFHYTGAYPESGIPLTTVVPAIGDEVWAEIGPLGLNPFLVTGIYSGRAGYADEKSFIDGMYVIALPGTFGASGSPVFDKYGRIWGIYVGGNTDLPGVALVVLVPQIPKL